MITLAELNTGVLAAASADIRARRMATLDAVACAAYNLTASCFRRDRHLRVNAIIYSLAAAWELKQTLHHLEAVSNCDEPDPAEMQAA